MIRIINISTVDIGMGATNERDYNGSDRNNFLFVRDDVHTTTICKLGVVTKFLSQANSVTIRASSLFRIFQTIIGLHFQKRSDIIVK